MSNKALCLGMHVHSQAFFRRRLNVHDILADIGDFIFVSDPPEQADAIMVAGGSHPELPEYAATLWKAGYAPRIFIGGGVSIKLG